MDRNELPLEPCHLGVPSVASKMIYELMVLLAQTVHLSWVKISSISARAEMSKLEPRRLEVPLGASKIISNPMVCLMQTMHLSCTDANSICKRTKTRFHMTLFTSEFHRVRPIWFLSLWYVRHKPCTYLASRLALSPNGPKWAST
jgi:hypothetical protein